MVTETKPQPRAGTSVFPITETFTSNHTENPNWRILGSAQLNGSLQLTPDDYAKAGAALLDEAFPSSWGVAIDFDYATEHSGGNSAGDGFCFFLIDGSATTEPGGFGAGLGYSYVKNTGSQAVGVSKGYVGIGFDTYGNFGTGLAGPDGPGNSTDMAGVRGSGDGWDGFHWLTGNAVSGGFSATWEDEAHAQIVIADGKITVRLSSKANPNGTAVISDVAIQGDGQAPLPDTLKLGIAASTGDATQAHRIRRLKITMPVDMPLEITGPEQAEAGTKVCYPVAVRNDGPNDAPDALVEVTLPAHLTQVTHEVKTDNGATHSEGELTNVTLRQELNLPKGATATVTVCGTIDPQFTGTLTIPATLTSPTRANTSTRQHAETNTHVTARKTPPTPLVVWQEGGVEDTPDGPGTTINICARTPNWTEQLTENQLQHVFTAPTGFRWNGTASAQYKHKDQTTSGNLPPVQATVSNDGRTLTFTYPVHLNTTTDDTGALVYICGIQPTPGTQPGRHTDGTAQIGTAPPGKLKAEITNPDD
ncbi:hypothetical protein ABZ760_12015 [Streptomyces sp. NPDC006658]|uniref:lectin-like domain-containing protein n=1 Tax=Streptomyces sp. NPDC006658 TaxID=3156900 RepID=UPI0033D604CD